MTNEVGAKAYVITASLQFKEIWFAYPGKKIPYWALCCDEFEATAAHTYKLEYMISNDAHVISLLGFRNGINLYILM